jgi:uncharacterized repeat protein (TIGR01451 family)
MKRTAPFITFIITLVLALPASPGARTQVRPVNMVNRLALLSPTDVETTRRVSVASDGTQGNYNSNVPSISADGRYVAFQSDSTNLVGWDTNGFEDVFVHDKITGQTRRVSVDSNGAQGNGQSNNSFISADGRYVAFRSNASNLVSGDTNGTWDVFIHDNITGQTTLVSVDNNGAQGNEWSDWPSISADGRYVAFTSGASNLVGGDTNGHWDIFVHDNTTGQTTRVSVDSNGAQGNGQSYGPFISADGRYVAFSSVASNLVGGDTNGKYDVFVHDRTTGQTRRVSVDSNGAQANGDSGVRSFSADGRYVAFESIASNLAGGDTNGYWDVFVHDNTTGQTRRVSIASNGTQGNGQSFDPSISTDGRYVAFFSDASNLVGGDTNGIWDVFVHDNTTGQTRRVSIASNGTQGNNGSQSPSISADGRYVAFASTASNLVSGDTNGDQDIFVHEWTFYGVVVAPPTDARSGAPGTTVNYSLNVTNNGNAPDTFNVAVSGNAWTTNAPASVGPIDPGSSQAVSVSVTIPSTAASGSTDTATITVTSQHDNTKSDIATLTTTANPVFGVVVAPHSDDGSGAPGTTVNYSLNVTNYGNAPDTFNVAVSGNAWTTNAPATLGPIAAGNSQSMVVSVTIPSSAAGGSWDIATITVTSQGDNGQSDSSALTTTANLVFGVVIDPASDFRSGAPGTTVNYSLNVTNYSNIPDTFDLSVTGNAWTTSAPVTLGPIATGASQALNVSVTIPTSAAWGSMDTATVTVTSQGDDTHTASSTLTTTANRAYGVVVAPPSDARSGAPGTTVTYSLNVTNNGNASDSFHVTVSGNAWTTNAPAAFGPMASGATLLVDVSVTIPASAALGTVDVAMITVTSQGDNTRSESATLTTTADNGVNISPHMNTRSGAPGTTVTYSLNVTNNSNASDTYNVTVDDNTWTTTAPATLGPIASGASQALNVSVTIPASAAAGNVDFASVTVTSQGDNTQFDSATLYTTASLQADLSVNLGASPNPVTIGNNLTYTIVVSNHGPASATHVVLTDYLPAGTAYVSNDSGCTQAGGLVTCNLGGLANGANKTVHIIVRVTAIGALIDTASVTSDQADPNPGNNSDSTTTQVYRKCYLPMIRK